MENVKDLYKIKKLTKKIFLYRSEKVSTTRIVPTYRWQAYADPDYKLNKAMISESVFNARDGDSALTYNAMCPATPVMINWRELRCQLAQIR